jgi:hypothetical protein
MKDEESIDKTLAIINEQNSISYQRHNWDSYTFQSRILNTKIQGTLTTRKAIEGTVSEQSIFKEHLRDYQKIIHYCLPKFIPYAEWVNSIKFDILTDRTQGYLYLIELVIIYDKNVSEIEYVEPDDLKTMIIEQIEQVDLYGAVYLMLNANKEEIEVTFASSPACLK